MRRLPAFILALLAALQVPPALAAPEELTGQVVGITDGDTLTLLTPDRRQTKVRLAEIDTPERRQPYGSRARAALADLAFQRRVRVVVEDIDRYGRSVGHVYAGGRDVNAEMVRRGAAWVYDRYNHDPKLPVLEAEARAARRGLWALPEAERLPPWEWRRRAKAERDAEPGQRRAAPG
ncbi:thermonuclease family protein [Dankookia sp. P2]|uniref:thermonuclease family protein n=1 Tax=Dankookia sp. P2 TaxID=3423955 RepID=UPI003D66F7BF